MNLDFASWTPDVHSERKQQTIATHNHDEPFFDTAFCGAASVSLPRLNSDTARRRRRRRRNVESLLARSGTRNAVCQGSVTCRFLSRWRSFRPFLADQARILKQKGANQLEMLLRADPCAARWHVLRKRLSRSRWRALGPFLVEW